MLEKQTKNWEKNIELKRSKVGTICTFSVYSSLQLEKDASPVKTASSDTVNVQG